MKYHYLLFDLDGTLFDYDRAESEALKNTFIQFGFSYSQAYLKTYRDINKVIWADFEKGKITQKKLKPLRFKLLSEALNLSFDPEKFSSNYLINLSKNTELLDGSDRLISELYGKVKLYLITNGLTIVQNPRIKNSTIGHYFEDAIISETVGYAKPQKEIFDIAFNYMNHPNKDEVLMIGDSLSSDITGGINYGIDTCWFNPLEKELSIEINPTYIIKDLNQLLDIVFN